MNVLARWTALVTVLLMWGCDQAGPADALGQRDSQASASDATNEFEDQFTLSGSVFVNDSDDQDPQREEDELGLERVRVDLYAVQEYQESGTYDAEPYDSDLTDEDGRYEFTVPSGDWVIRVTPQASAHAFNPILYHAYNPLLHPAELSATVSPNTPEVTGLDFGFNADLDQILSDLKSGNFQTDDAQPVRVWRRWLRQAAAERNCPRNRPNWACRPELEGYLASIFSNDGDPFFGNAVPYSLPDGADAFAEGASILREPLKTDLEKLKAEVFAMELNYFAGLGSGNRLYDKAIGYYLEERIKDLQTGGGEARVGGAAEGVVMASATAAASLELQIARAYNGGGGGGKVGEN